MLAMSLRRERGAMVLAGLPVGLIGALSAA
jgi:hypothetical protein